jgi:hypothetical protein
MRTRQAIFPAAAALLLAACASTPKPAVLPPAPAPLDASYDWRVLVTAPFGTLLKDMPLPVHEVLLFRDAGHGAAPADEGECYAVNGTPPRFIQRTPEVYLLCFKRDRLQRIEASVRAEQAEAAKIYADACGLWTTHAASGNTAACEGVDGNVAFSGHLEDDAENVDALISIKIYATDG